jgi:hypothetical protein
MREYRSRKKQAELQNKQEEITIDKICNGVNELKCA